MASSLFFITTCAAAILFKVYKKLKSHQENKTVISSSSSSSSSSVSSCSSSSFSRTSKHHVFPSFHGSDVRKTLLSHILENFKRKGIDPFMDSEIERNKFISPELVEAIKGSRIAIVLLSKNYASSTWCLNELVKIMESREEFGLIVITVFYQVDPTDIKKQTGRFGKAFKTACVGKSKEQIKKWKQSLEDVAMISGYHSNNWENEAAMIEKISSDISNLLNLSIIPSTDFDSLIGIEAHMVKMETLLSFDLDEVRMVGIWGPSGIGKSTIARFLFNEFSNNFQLSTIMMNIKGIYPRNYHDEYSMKLQLQNQLLSQLINHKDIQISHMGVAQERLKDKKVLIILDDVDKLGQLDALAKETGWFGPGSRIIITTEDRRVLKAHGIPINQIYKMSFPVHEEALQIFCMSAFGQKNPKDGFEKLAEEVTKLAGRLPLGLKIMGSYVKGMSKQEWKMALPRLRSGINGEIESVLMFSFDGLCDEDKDLFLHVACFSKGEWIRRAEEYLSKSFLDVRQGLLVLADRSLISIRNGFIEMHDLLAQLGRKIVLNKSIHEPGKRQFLVDTKEICEVLIDESGTRNVIGINLNFYTLKEELCISEKAFEGMSNLQFLRINGGLDHRSRLYLPRGLVNLSRKLRLLHWRHFPLRSFPSNFNSAGLVELIMHHSELEKLWDGVQPLRNLKWMNLMSSKNLKELPDLSTATNLERLNLEYCSSLVKLPSSIGKAIKLKRLWLIDCSNLLELPYSIGNAMNLLGLNLKGCSNLKELPSSIWNAINLEELNLTDCINLVELPCFTQRFRKISHLRRLVINGCKKLVSLPELPDSLSELDAENCESLERLDCSFLNPKICLNFGKCFKLNKEARDEIIETSSCEITILPGDEVPDYFTYRGNGGLLRVKLKDRPFPSAVIFKACCLLVNLSGDEVVDGEMVFIDCRIIDNQNGLDVLCSPSFQILPRSLTKHLYTFEFEADVTSGELLFEFEVSNGEWIIHECGVLQLFQVPSC